MKFEYGKGSPNIKSRFPLVPPKSVTVFWPLSRAWAISPEVRLIYSALQKRKGIWNILGFILILRIWFQIILICMLLSIERRVALLTFEVWIKQKISSSIDVCTACTVLYDIIQMHIILLGKIQVSFSCVSTMIHLHLSLCM